MRIGFTGHRPNRLRVPSDRLRVRIGEALNHLVASTAGQASPSVAFSPLAEGSDRIFAEAALEQGLTLEALLPMPVDEYLQTFEDASTNPDFYALLNLTKAKRELPGSLADSKAAYAKLGEEMVATSDVIVTVWDGKPAAGRGGTPEVIAEAIEMHRPVVWVSANEDVAPCWLDVIEPEIIVRSI